MQLLTAAFPHQGIYKILKIPYPYKLKVCTYFHEGT